MTPSNEDLTAEPLSRPEIIKLLAIAVPANLAMFLLILWVFVPRSIETGPATVKTVALEDGSLVRLAPKSWIDIEYSRSTRLVTLVQGSAQFSIVSDPERPFIVSTSAGEIESPDASLLVRKEPRTLAVAVYRGSAAVGIPDYARIFLRGGQQVSASVNGIGPIEHLGDTRGRFDLESRK